MTQTEKISIAGLEALVASAFVASRTSPENAASVARALVLAEMDGKKGHGLSRVSSYAAQASSGKVDGHARPIANQMRPGVVMIDASHGFAYPALDLAHAHLRALVRSCGVAAAGITRSHHFGVAGHQAEQLADVGLVALVFGNTPKAIAPWGGKRGVFGTNPIAFAAPRRDASPIVVDLALSEVARGNILKAKQAGKPIPRGWAFDQEGHPTIDPDAALEGTMSPFGGAKGAALAFVVEVLAAALTGANLAGSASSFFTSDGPPPGVGQLVLGLDPEAFAGAGVFFERIEALSREISMQPGARLPGESRIKLRKAAREQGLVIDNQMLNEIRTIAEGEKQ